VSDDERGDALIDLERGDLRSHARVVVVWEKPRLLRL
jgi:hypothetical protein